MDDCPTAGAGSDWDDGRGGEPQAIGEILVELLSEYQVRFPELPIAVVEVPAAA